jgi:hypothetical protein
MPSRLTTLIWFGIIIIIFGVGAIFILGKHAPLPQENKQPIQNQSRKENALPPVRNFISSNAVLLNSLILDFDNDNQKEIVILEEEQKRNSFSNIFSEAKAVSSGSLKMIGAGGCAYQTRLFFIKYNRAEKLWEKKTLYEICGSRLIDYFLERTDLNKDKKEELLFKGRLEGGGHFLIFKFFAKKEGEVKEISFIPSPERIRIEGEPLSSGILSPSLGALGNFLVYQKPLTKDKFAKKYDIGVVYYSFNGEALFEKFALKCPSERIKNCIEENLPQNKE